MSGLFFRYPSIRIDEGCVDKFDFDTFLTGLPDELSLDPLESFFLYFSDDGFQFARTDANLRIHALIVHGRRRSFDEFPGDADDALRNFSDIAFFLGDFNGFAG